MIGVTDGFRDGVGRDAPDAYWSTLGQAVDTWGEDVQIDIALEELGELVTALSRLRRHRVTEADVAEEIADVQIMLDQMQIVFDEPDVDAEIERKINRLRDRLDDVD